MIVYGSESVAEICDHHPPLPLSIGSTMHHCFHLSSERQGQALNHNPRSKFTYHFKPRTGADGVIVRKRNPLVDFAIPGPTELSLPFATRPRPPPPFQTSKTTSHVVSSTAECPMMDVHAVPAPVRDSLRKQLVACIIPP